MEDDKARPSPAPSDDGGLPPGTVIDRYVVIGRLGAGGASVVLAAFDPTLDRKVAIKLLRATDSQNQARLHREAQAMARLTHPNVMPIFDVGTFQDRVFLAMELVEGGTLRQWLREERAPREVLSVLLQAGRGLAAAHAAGLVHRDFKPDNVLVGGASGRVLVTDFGLVRSALSDGDERQGLTLEDLRAASDGDGATLDGSPGGAQPTAETVDAVPAGRAAMATTRHGRSPDSPLTHQKAIVGTPGYMAPEQYLAQPTDTRSDQFSFCVTLFEALYGRQPIAGKNLYELARAATQGQLVEPPRGTRVPAHVHRILVRGLSPKPADRFASMDALLAALADDPAERRRRRVLALGALVAAAVIVVGVGALARRRTELCRGAELKLAGVWDDARRAAVEQALVGDGHTSRTAWQGVKAALDGWSAEWVAMRQDACEATRLRGEQPESVLALRMECLDGELKGLSALTSVLAQADADVAQRAPEAVGRLPPVSACADVAALSAPVPPPTTPAARAQVGAVRDELAQAWALLIAGRYQQGLGLATHAAESAHHLEYAPLEAEADALRGDLLSEAGENEDAEPVLEQALYEAYRGRHDRFVARAAMGLVSVSGYWLARYGDGHRWARLADAAIARLGGSDDLRMALLRKEAGLYEREGAPAEALRTSREALALCEKIHGRESVNTALARVVLGNAELTSGDRAAAQRDYAAALAIYERVAGADHPLAADALNNLGNVAYEAGDFARAESFYRRALAISLVTIGREHPDTASRLFNLASALLAQKKTAEALDDDRRALAIYEQHGSPADQFFPLVGIGEALSAEGKWSDAAAPLERAVDLGARAHVAAADLAEARFALAEVRWRGGAHAAATALAEEARAGYAGQADKQAAIARWLDAHGDSRVAKVGP